MEITASKIAALLVALAYIVVAFGFGAPLKVLALFCLVLAVPLGLIWFPDECGGITGTVSRGYITRETPGGVVAAVGWFLLVAYPAIVYLVTRNAAKG